MYIYVYTHTLIHSYFTVKPLWDCNGSLRVSSHTGVLLVTQTTKSREEVVTFYFHHHHHKPWPFFYSSEISSGSPVSVRPVYSTFKIPRPRFITNVTVLTSPISEFVQLCKSSISSKTPRHPCLSTDTHNFFHLSSFLSVTHVFGKKCWTVNSFHLSTLRSNLPFRPGSFQEREKKRKGILPSFWLTFPLWSTPSSSD